MKKNNLSLFLAITLVPITIGIVLNVRSTNAQTSVIPNGLALDLALSYSMDDGLMGGALNPPAKVYGQVMTYEEAVKFVLNKPIDSNTQNYKTLNKTVWLVVLEGEFVEHVPPSADGIIPAKEVIHNQMAIILDGNTGEIMRRILLSPQIKLSVANLPVLQKTNAPLPALPTSVPISTEVPYPTLPPAELLNKTSTETASPVP